MNYRTTHLGIALIVVGTLTLVATRIDGMTNHNWLLLMGLLLIVAGIVLHVRGIKHEGDGGLGTNE
jgi:LPXTG-motif cell wall-anchored protein